MISIIAAMSLNRVIGQDNALPWKIPGDLKRFKELTTGHPIIMGRKTFESIGRPLPGRPNLVVTRNAGWTHESAEVQTFSSLEAALEAAQAMHSHVFVIGGGEIYRQALSLADSLFITEVKTELAGDAFFPEIPTQFDLAERVEGPLGVLPSGVSVSTAYLKYSRRN